MWARITNGSVYGTIQFRMFIIVISKYIFSVGRQAVMGQAVMGQAPGWQDVVLLKLKQMYQISFHL